MAEKNKIETSMGKKLPASNLLTEHITNRSARPNYWAIVSQYRKAIAIAIVLLIVATAAVFFFVRYQQATNKLKQLQVNGKSSPEEIKSLIDKVGKLAVLPSGEDPTIASVTNPAKLADQPFFANAREGDKVLIYTVARRAILYRPSENKIIEIAPLNIDDNAVISPDIQSQSSSDLSLPSESTADSEKPKTLAPKTTTSNTTVDTTSSTAPTTTTKKTTTTKPQE